MKQCGARQSRLWLITPPRFVSSAAVGWAPELGGVTGSRAGLAQHPDYPLLSPSPSSGRQQATGSCWGCHPWFSLSSSNRCVWWANTLQCLLHRWTCCHLTEFQPFTPIKEGNNNAVLFSPGFSICCPWLCPKWIKKSIYSLSASVKSNLFTVSAE